MPQAVMAPVRESVEVELLRELVAGQRRIIALLERRQRPVSLSREDRKGLARLLPAVAGVYGAEPFSARDLAEDDRPAVSIVVGGRSAKLLGKLLSRADGIGVDGLMLQRQGIEYQVTQWSIVAC